MNSIKLLMIDIFFRSYKVLDDKHRFYLLVVNQASKSWVAISRSRRCVYLKLIKFGLAVTFSVRTVTNTMLIFVCLCVLVYLFVCTDDKKFR